MSTIVESPSFIPLQNLVATQGIKYFVETDTNGKTLGAEAACRLGLKAFLCAGESAVSLHAQYPDLDIFNGDAHNFLKHILPQIDGPALFWLDPNDPNHNAYVELISHANESVSDNWFTIYKAEPNGHTIGADFDRNWVGPEELKPACYRSQSEKDTWYACVVENDYQLPSLNADDVVVDIGAHIGGFSYRAYLNGSRKVYSFEIDSYHLEAAYQNLAGKEDGIEVYHAAVVRGDEHRAPQYFYKGDWNSFSAQGDEVPSISLDEILEPHDAVRFMKMDCEGGEWPILYTCTQLNKVQQIAGEYHLIDASAPEVQNLPHPISLEGLSEFLLSQGFKCAIVPLASKTGNFFAWRE